MYYGGVYQDEHIGHVVARDVPYTFARRGQATRRVAPTRACGRRAWRAEKSPAELAGTAYRNGLRQTGRLLRRAHRLSVPPPV